MNKKFLSLVLALVMVLGTFGNVFAAAAPEKKEVKEVPKLTSTDAKVKWLIDNSIVIGNAGKDGKPTGDMDLKSPIRRDAVAKMLVYAIGEKDLADKLQGVYRPFPDVELTNIMNGYIAAAASRTSVNGVAIINGYDDGLFRPTKNVSYAELAKMLVVAIDKDLTPAKAASYSWYQDWINRAVQLGIFDGVAVDKANAPAVRSDAFAMIYNAFFKLKELKAVPSNETRGVISESSDGTTLVLNQGEFKKEFKVTKDTVFVNQQNVAKKWIFNNVAAQNYYVGSVVRVLSDKDGVVTHIIEMGNPVNGIANRNAAWEDLGNQTLNVRQSAWNASANDVTLGKDSIAIKGSMKSYEIQGKKIVVNTADASYDVTSKTVFYVADPDKNVLTQVKDYAAAKALVADKNNKTYNVYLAYETLPSSAVKEAKVVVFNKANVEMNKQLVRVTAAVSAPDYLLSAQKPGEASTEVLQYNLSKVNNVWPYNYKLEAFDVVKLAVSADGKSSNADRDLVIDYSEAPIYKVEKFLLVENGKETEVDRAHANAVLLRDKEDFVRRYDLPTDYSKFFGNQFTVGSHVQIAFRDANKVILDVVSVVNHDLRGNLEGGIDTKLVKGKLVEVLQPTPADKAYRVKIVEEGNRRATDFVSMQDLSKYKGSEVEVEVNYITKGYNVPEILRVVSSKMVPVAPAENVEKAALDEIGKVLNGLERDAKGAILPNAANKAALEDAKTKQGALTVEANKNDMKEIINILIDQYNNADKDAGNDVTPIA